MRDLKIRPNAGADPVSVPQPTSAGRPSPAAPVRAASLARDHGVVTPTGRAAPVASLMASQAMPTAVQLESRAVKLGERILRTQAAGLDRLAAETARANPFFAASLDVRADLQSMTWWAREGRVAPLVDLGNQISRLNPLMGRRVFRLAADAGAVAGKTDELLAIGRDLAASGRRTGAASLLSGAVRSAARQGDLRQLSTIGEEAATLARQLGHAPQEARQFARVAQGAYAQIARLATEAGGAMGLLSQAAKVVR